MPFVVQDNGILLECTWDIAVATDPDIALARAVVAEPPRRSLSLLTERQREVWRQYWRGGAHPGVTPPPLAVGVYGDPADT
jgi:hypothetical protein